MLKERKEEEDKEKTETNNIPSADCVRPRHALAGVQIRPSGLQSATGWLQIHIKRRQEDDAASTMAFIVAHESILVPLCGPLLLLYTGTGARMSSCFLLLCSCGNL